MTALQAGRMAGLAFDIVPVAFGVLDLLLVHPAPAVAHGLVSPPCLPPVGEVL